VELARKIFCVTLLAAVGSPQLLTNRVSSLAIICAIPVSIDLHLPSTRPFVVLMATVYLFAVS
jgi:hypothetical protein